LPVCLQQSARLARQAFIPQLLPNLRLSRSHHKIIPFYELIGRATSAWARLEHTLDLIIWDLVGAPSETIACITAQIIGATNRHKTIEALLKQRKSPQLGKLVEKVDALKKRTYGPNEDRNRIIHDPWYLYDTKTAQFRAMPPKDPRFGVCVVDINDINTFIETANKLSSRAAEIRNEILAALRP
jgi:hypothetical protein